MTPTAPSPEPIDIFLSYKREEKPLAEALAHALMQAGWDVWWDVELRGGDRYDDVIGQALKRARCVVVMWSQQAVQSNYIRDEAATGLRDGKVIPVRLDDVEVPFRYQNLHIIDLREWSRDKDNARLGELLDDLRARLGTPGEPKSPPAPTKPARRIGKAVGAVAVVALIATLATAVLINTMRLDRGECILDIRLQHQQAGRVPLALAVRTSSERRRIALQRDDNNLRAQAKLSLAPHELSNWVLAVVWNAGDPSTFSAFRGCQSDERTSEDGVATLVATRL